MKNIQFQNILKFRLGGTVGAPLLCPQLDGYTSILSIDKAIFRKKIASGRYTYFILNSKVLDSVRALNFHPSHKNAIAYNCVVSCMYGNGDHPYFEGFVLTGLDLAVDVDVRDLAPQLGFSFAFFQRLLVGAYSSCSKRITMSLDAFTRYVLKNNASAKAAQTVFYELYNVQENKFVAQAEVPAGDVLLEAQRRAWGSTVGIPTDFFFGKERLKRSRVSSSSFSFDLDIYDKGLKESNVKAYQGLTRFELRFRGCKFGRLEELGLPLASATESRRLLVEGSFLRFLDRSVLLRQRPSRRVAKTSFSNVHRWPEDGWWSSIKKRLLGCRVFHLDDPVNRE